MRSFTSFLALVAVIMGTLPVHADLTGAPPEPPKLTDTQRQLVDANPDLAALEATAPWLLKAVVVRLLAAPKAAIGSDDPFTGLNADDADFLRRNPAFISVHMASPEAAVELLALIRAAAGGRPVGKAIP